MSFQKINYDELNGRQKESYNFQKVSGVLADFGFSTIRLSDDWEGADFIAQHKDGKIFLKVQLKGRFTLAEKYEGKDLYICFSDTEHWYLVPHDTVLSWVKNNTTHLQSVSWSAEGLYSFPTLSSALKAHLAQYRLVAAQPDVYGLLPQEAGEVEADRGR